MEMGQRVEDQSEFEYMFRNSKFTYLISSHLSYVTAKTINSSSSMYTFRIKMHMHISVNMFFIQMTFEDTYETKNTSLNEKNRF